VQRREPCGRPHANLCIVPRDLAFDVLLGCQRRPNGADAFLPPSLVEQRPGFLQVSRVKTLGEPAVHRRQQVVGLPALILGLPQARQAGGGAEFQGLGERLESGLALCRYSRRCFLRRAGDIRTSWRWFQVPLRDTVRIGNTVRPGPVGQRE
jgi:hypothetical protein